MNELTSDQKNILNNTETIFVVENIRTVNNGLMNSVIRKMRFMESEWGYKPLLLITDYNVDLARIKLLLEREDFKDDQVFLNKGTRILSLYDYYQKTDRESLDLYGYKQPEENENYIKIADRTFAAYKDGVLQYKDYFTGFHDRLRMVEQFNNGKKTKTIYYDDNECVSKIRIHDTNDSEYYPFEYYYTTEGKCRIIADYKNEKEIAILNRYKLNKLRLYDEDGVNIIKECASNAELAAVYLDQITNDDKKIYLAVAENGFDAPAVDLQTKRNIAKVSVMHSTFLKDANDLKSEPQKFYKYLCEHNNSFDGVVFPTEWERKDYIKLYGDIRNTFTIPHPYPHDIIKSDFEKRDKRKIIIISRYNSEKMINYAIDIFKYVVDEIPDVKLELHGFGNEEDNYRNQIETLGIKSNVIINGYTNDPASIMRGAAAFMMTSYVEGFGLTLMESICNGCPAFAFDIKYGPNEIIKDGQTGYLIPFGNKRMYADKLINYFKDEELPRRMSENCYNDAPRFSKEIFLEKWYKFTETMYRRCMNK